MKEVERKEEKRRNRFVNREWKKLWYWLEKEMDLGIFYFFILEKSIVIDV